MWKKCYNNFFWHIFLGAHTIQIVTKYIWMPYSQHLHITQYEYFTKIAAIFKLREGRSFLQFIFSSIWEKFVWKFLFCLRK